MNNRRLIITSVISIILISLLMIGSTYSIFTTGEIDENQNVYTTGNLDISYTASDDSVVMENNIPMSDADASSVKPYRITVTNNGNVPYKFDLILDDTTASNVIDYQYIKVQVGYYGPVLLSECTDGIIKKDIIIGAGSSVNIDVRVWLSDNIVNSQLGKSFYGKLVIDGFAVYNDEIVDNSDLSLNYMNTSSENDFRSETYIDSIKNISFVDYIDTSEKVASWDMSVDEDNSIVAWLNNNETDGYYDLYIGSKREIYAKSLYSLFDSMIYVENISFDNFNSSLTTNMYKMFYSTGSNNGKLKINFCDKFNTYNVTNMGQMFWGTGVQNLDLGNKFDTSNVINMYQMFYGTTKLTDLDLGDKFDTSNVTDMTGMFWNAAGIYNLDLGSKFDTSNVTDMAGMFNSMFNLTKLDLGNNFDTGNVKNMVAMFYNTGYSSTVFTLNLGDKFDTSNVTDMTQMFRYAGKNNPNFVLDLGDKFNTSNVIVMNYMFGYTGYANDNFELDLSTFDFSKVTSYTGMFLDFKTTQKIYVKDASDRAWIVDKGFTNVTVDNVLIKS